MTDTLTDGGSAFPTVESEYFSAGAGMARTVYRHIPGMTLRQWFAGLYMQGLATNFKSILSFKEEAQASVRAADALIAELAKEAKP